MRAACSVAVAAALCGLAAAGEIDLARQKSAASDWAGAEAHYRRALQEKDDPLVREELAAVLYNRAVTLGRDEKYEETIPLLTEACRLAPALMDARLALVLSYDKLGRKTEASVTLARLGDDYLAAGNAAKAKEAYAEARRRSNRPEYRLGEGDSLLLEKDYHGALTVYRGLLGTPMKGPGLYRRMGDAYEGLGLVKQAIESFESAATLDGTPAAALYLARIYSVRGEWEQAIAKISQAEAKGAKRDEGIAFLLANAHYRRGVARMEAGSGTEAARDLEAAVAAAESGISARETSELYQVKGLALLMQKQFDRAAAALERGIELAGGEAPRAVHEALQAARAKASGVER